MSRPLINLIRISGLVLGLAGMLLFIPRSSNSSWTVGEHPRLIMSDNEKDDLLAKLTTSGSVAKAIWDNFKVNNFKNYTRDYADGAILYWLNNDSAAGLLAIAHAKSFMSGYPNGLSTDSSGFDPKWYRYHDLTLTYDFAYDLLTPEERTQFIDYIALQGAKCSASSAGWAPGNINTLWIFCEEASAILLDGEDYSKPVVDEAVVRGATADTADSLHYPKDATSIKITNAPGQETADYTYGVDYTYEWFPGCQGECVNWSLAGAEPAPGATYYVSYTFAPDLADWKTISRTDFEKHLNYQWTDGYYGGDLSPYGNLVSELLPFFFEMFRRDANIDYRYNDDIKHIVDMYTYTKLPSVPTGLVRRFNTINDSNWWNVYYADAWTYPTSPVFSNYRTWLRPFVAWATTTYANDPEGYGNRYVWLWTKAYRTAAGAVDYNSKPADWREAFWINNATVTPYLNTTAVPAATWPLQRYFRGKEVIVAKTETWSTPNTAAAYMSMIAGNHNYLNEHDQGDAGSFTFFSLNEDWAMDPGYSDTYDGWHLEDHNSVGIDLHGYQTTGTYGADNSNGIFGGFAHFGDVALTSDASAIYADLGSAWTLSATPYVQRDDRYLVTINGAQTSYTIVADDIAKDTANHSYEWYLHTGLGNTVSIDGRTATITGSRTGALLKVYSLGPETTTITQALSTAGDNGSHQRIMDQVTNVQAARFLHLLIPSNATRPAPTVASTAVTGGTQATVTWADGTIDTILWRYDGDTITGSDSLVSDAKVTVTRQVSGQIRGLIAVRGRSVVREEQTILSVLDGTAPVTVAAMGSTAGLYATDSARLGIGLSTVTAATLEDGSTTIPVTNDGTTAWINGGLPLAEMRRNSGTRYNEPFSNGYQTKVVRFDYEKAPVDQFNVVDGALELRATTYDWPSLTKRDSTPYRRAQIYPTIIPALDHGDAVYNLRYRFDNATAAVRKFRIYLRTYDRQVGDWSTNQDYVRLELDAPENTVNVGQRVDGEWVWNPYNNNLTATLDPAQAQLDDADWHDVSVKLQGDRFTLTIDGIELMDTTLPTLIPTAPAHGYIQFQVEGTSPVWLDSVSVVAIDQTVPAAPTAGLLIIDADGSGRMTLAYGHGSSTDAYRLTLYESANEIAAETDPATLTAVASATSSLTTMEFSGADRLLYHAVGVEDLSGNASILLPLEVDIIPPEAVTDLRTES